MNEKVKKVGKKIESVGLQVKIEVTHPEWILFGDEFGADISMKDDGHVSGQKFVGEKVVGPIQMQVIKMVGLH